MIQMTKCNELFYLQSDEVKWLMHSYATLYRSPQLLKLRVFSRFLYYNIHIHIHIQATGLVHNAHANSFTSHIMYKDKYKEPGLDVDWNEHHTVPVL